MLPSVFQEHWGRTQVTDSSAEEAAAIRAAIAQAKRAEGSAYRRRRRVKIHLC